MKINNNNLYFLIVITSLLSSNFNVQAKELSEIIVTATKRQLNLQDTPIAIAVISGSEIEQHSFCKFGYKFE